MLLKNGLVYLDGGFDRMDVFLENDRLKISSPGVAADFPVVYDVSEYFIFPGLADVHVHLREPGFSYKETIATGTAAAARGGYTALCAMPNLNPAPDCMESLQVQLDLIKKHARVAVLPYGTITKGGTGRGDPVDFHSLKEHCAAFSDDGKGVQSRERMKKAMRAARQENSLIAAHCEDESLLRGGCVHDGDFARRHGYTGISSESEWRQLERDLELVRETGCDYHMCHVSSKESVELIRKAKREGLPVSCETAPHYLLLSDMELGHDGRFKMNPPVRSAEDRDALISGLRDGTIDLIATDHAPHSREEKSRGLTGSAMGVSGLEAALPVLYTGLVQKGVISLEKLIELMCIRPRQRFKLGFGKIESGEIADFTVFDPTVQYKLEGEDFLSLGKATPFDGWTVSGEVVMTVAAGRVVWKSDRLRPAEI